MAEASRNPRVVIVTRQTPYERLLARHGTHGQCRFFLESRGQTIDDVLAAHDQEHEARARVAATIPLSWRRAAVDRRHLDRFLFEPEDIVVAIGQDGLVANAAKYLGGLLVIGINPDPSRFDGILVKHPPGALGDLLGTIAAGRHHTEDRTMVEASVDGMRLRALNEIFVGHRTHQSARYTLTHGPHTERHSSSGLIVSTGTGATGWARSISRQCGDPIALPSPEAPELAFFVREAFPSIATQTHLTHGIVHEALRVRSEMNDGGVIFGDGIEDDRIHFDWGRTVHIRPSPQKLHLVQP